MNHTPGDRAVPAFSDHLPSSGGVKGSGAHGRFGETVSIPHRRYFFGDAFQPLAAIILRARFQLSMNTRRIFWVTAGVCIALAVLATAGASVWMSRFLRGEAFRKLIARETGEALGSEVVYGPLRWTGASLFADSLQATGLPGSVVENLHADQV
ncbi:MAG: hypothetical protein WCC08_24505, partial [Terrimicrobiaceae bacterium]